MWQSKAILHNDTTRCMLTVSSITKTLWHVLIQVCFTRKKSDIVYIHATSRSVHVDAIIW